MYNNIHNSVMLTLVGDEVCENAMQRAAVCQVIQRPGAVGYEQPLVSGTWRRVSVTQWGRVI